MKYYPCVNQHECKIHSKLIGWIVRGKMKEKLRSSLAFSLGPFLGLLSGPILARMLGPEGRGQFAAIMQPLTLGTAFASIGIPITASYFISKGISAKRLIRWSLITVSISCTSIFILLGYYSKSISESQNLDRELLIAIWGSIYISVLIELRRGFILGIGYTLRLDYERIFIALLRFIGILAILKISIVRVEYFSILMVGMVLIPSLILWFPRVKVPNSISMISRSEFIKYLVPASAVSVSLVIAARLDQFILPLQTSSVEVGYYAVAVTIAEVPLIFTNLISRTTFKDAVIGGRFESQLKKSRMYFILGFSLTFIIYLLTELAIKYIFGVDFLSAIPIVRILCLSSCLAIINSALIFHLNGSGRTIGAAVTSISALIPISIGFALNWGEVFGSMAAWINVYSQLMVMLVGLIILKGNKYVRSA